MESATQLLNFFEASVLICGATVPLIFRGKLGWTTTLVIVLCVMCWIVTASLIEQTITEAAAAMARRTAVGGELSMDEIAYDGNGDRVYALFLSWVLPLVTAVPATIVAWWLKPPAKEALAAQPS